MEKKIIGVGSKTVAKFLAGVDQMDELVGGTLGPAGRNRIIYRKYRSPLITNDGVTIARHAYLPDPIEDLAAQTLVEVAMKTNDQVGDGTTTSIVIASALIRTCMQKIREASSLAGFGGKGVNGVQIARQIWAALPDVLKRLEAMKHDLEGDELDDVIATSLENLEYGKTLGKLMRDVGKDGYVSVEDNWGTKYGIDTEVTRGMRFLGTYASPYLANERNQKEAVWENALVLVTNERIEAPTVIAELIKEVQSSDRRRLVIIGGFSEGTNPYSNEFIAGCARVMQAAAQGNPNVIQILAVKAPTLTSEELEDIAVYCNAKFFNKNMGDRLRDARLIHLGGAKRISVTEDEVNVIEGQGDPTQRIEVLKEQQNVERDPMFEEKRKRRIASLSSGVGIIRVGAATEQERTYLKYKLEDAVHAAKAALEEGIVPGAGRALKTIAEELGKEHVLYEALMAPFNRIQDNAGGDLEVSDSVVDPHKVVRLALSNACSAASTLVTCDGAIAEERMTLLDFFEKKLGKLHNDTDDFRDNENQDLGRGRNVD